VRGSRDCCWSRRAVAIALVGPTIEVVERAAPVTGTPHLISARGGPAGHTSVSTTLGAGQVLVADSNDLPG
jgi:hypothetical protein